MAASFDQGTAILVNRLMRQFFKGLPEIFNEIIGIFQTHGDSHHALKRHGRLVSCAVALNEQTFKTAPGVASAENFQGVNHGSQLIGVLFFKDNTE